MDLSVLFLSQVWGVLSYFFSEFYLFLALLGLHSCNEQGLRSSYSVWASHWGDLSLWSTDSRYPGFSSCWHRLSTLERMALFALREVESSWTKYRTCARLHWQGYS